MLLNLINTYSDFLNLDETSLLELAKEQGDEKPFPLYGDIRLTQLANNIKNRTLPKRCLENLNQYIINVFADF